MLEDLDCRIFYHESNCEEMHNEIRVFFLHTGNIKLSGYGRNIWKTDGEKRSGENSCRKTILFPTPSPYFGLDPRGS